MEAVEYWMGELSGKSDSTKEKYFDYFKRFADWLGEDPEEIIQNRREDVRSDDVRVQRRYESKLLSYITYLKQKGYSTSTQQVAFAAVSSFFEMNYLPLRMRRGDYPSGDSMGYRAATKEDILRLLDAAGDDSRLRAVILFLKDSGLRVSDLVRLRFRDVSKYLEEGDEFIPLQIVTKKNGILAKTAIGPEAVTALKNYLAHRREGTRAIDSEDIAEHAPLFKARANDVRHLSRSSVSSTFNYLVAKAGLGGEISAHSLRKFTETKLEAAGVNPNWVDQIIGHRLPGSRGNYSRPEDDDLFQVYVDAYNELRVFEVPASAAELEKTAAELRKAQSELQEMKTDLAYQMSKRMEMEKKFEQSDKKVQQLETDMVNVRSLLLGVLNNPDALEETRRRLSQGT